MHAIFSLITVALISICTLTLTLLHLFFPKKKKYISDFSLSLSFHRYIWGGLLVLFGIFLNVYSKNREKMKLPSVKDLKNLLLTGKKVRFLSQNV